MPVSALAQPQVPIGHVTNGVHTPSWDSAAADSLWTTACGPERWRGTLETVGSDIRSVADAALWELRATNRLELVGYVRERLATEWPHVATIERSRSPYSTRIL